MLARKLSAHIAIDRAPCFADSVEHLSRMHSIVCAVDVARAATRNEVRRDRFATIFARQQVIELRTLDR
jgi:hypothetical protein